MPSVSDSSGSPNAMDRERAELLLDEGDKESLQQVLQWLSSASATSQNHTHLWARFASHEQRDVRADALAAVTRLDRATTLELLPLWENDADPLLSRRAATWFLVANDIAARQAAIRFADSADSQIRLQAARWIAHSPDSDTLPSLVKLALDRDVSVLKPALESLRQRHGGALLFCITSILRRDIGKDVEEAKRQLDRLSPAEFPVWVSQAIDWLETVSFPVDPVDAFALLRYADAETISLLRKRRNQPPWLREALVRMDGVANADDASAIARLMSACDDDTPSVRECAIAMLAHHDAADPGRVLAQLMKHSRPDVRQKALSLLDENAGRILPRVRNALSDEDAGVRRSAYEILARFMLEDALPLWVRALRDDDPDLRSWAFDQIADLPYSPLLRETFARVARCRDENLRIRAAEILAQKHVFEPRLARAFAEALERRLDEPKAQAELTVALIHAVGQTAPSGSLELLLKAAQDLPAPIRRVAVDVLLTKPRRTSLMAAAQLTNVEDPDILRRVAEFLARHKDPRGLVPLLRSLDECPGSGEKLRPLLTAYPQVKQLRFLLRMLKERWPSVKRFAVRALIELESPEMIEPLLAATKDPDVEVQRAAVQALAKFAKRPEVERRLIELRDQSGDETTRQNAIAMLLGMDPASVIEPLLNASRDDDVEVQFAAVQALGKYAQRPEVAKRLIELLDYGDISVREKAMETLGDYQVKEAVEPLIRYLGNPFLKFRAQEALMRIGDRKGILAIKRFKIRESLYGKKKTKGPVAPILRKGKLGRPKKGPH